MPPIRPGRASKACDSCRKQKTRCYESENRRGACLRCDTLKHLCSLEQDSIERQDSAADTSRNVSKAITTDERYRLASIASLKMLISSRLARLESTVDRLVEHMESSSEILMSQNASLRAQVYSASNESTTAPPVFLIRDVAKEVGVDPGHSITRQPEHSSDIVSSGLLTTQDATALLALFVIHVLLDFHLTCLQIPRALWPMGRIR